MALRELAEKMEIIHRLDPEGTSEFTQSMIEKMEVLHRNIIQSAGEYLHGDSVHTEDPTKVKNVLDLIPQALTIKNDEGSLPRLSLALRYGVKWTEELRGVIHAQGDQLGVVGSDDGLFPFLQAVVGDCELSVVYDLLRRYPDALVQSTASTATASTATATATAIGSSSSSSLLYHVDDNDNDDNCSMWTSTSTTIQDKKRAKIDHNEMKPSAANATE